MPMSLDCLGQTCLAPSLRLARRLQKKLRERRVGQNALQGVLSRLFLRVGCSLLYIAGFHSYQWLISCLVPGDAETIPGVSGIEGVSAGMEIDGWLRGRHIVVTRSLVLLAGGPSMMSLRLSTVEVRAGSCWSRHLMTGNICVQMRKLLVLFQFDSKYYHISCLLDQFVTDPAAIVIRATGHQMVSLCRSVCEEEKAQLLSPLMNSLYFLPQFGSTVFVFGVQCTFCC